MIYGDIDPSSIMHSDTVYQIDQSEGDYTLRIKLPFVKKDYVDLFKEDGNLVVRIGSFKRHVFLPRVLVGRKPGRASLDNNVLSIAFPKSA